MAQRELSIYTLMKNQFKCEKSPKSWLQEGGAGKGGGKNGGKTIFPKNNQWKNVTLEVTVERGI